MKDVVLSVLVQNNAGVLARIASLFGSRGYNITTLTVSPTDNNRISRIIIAVYDDEIRLNMIIKQIEKLQETIKVEQMVESDSLCKELVLVKVETADQDAFVNLMKLRDEFSAKLVDKITTSLMLELSDVPSTVERFVDALRDYHILEISRTGVTALARCD